MSELAREQLLMAVISGRGPAYLRGVDLSTIDLSNAGWLVEADLRQADLSVANLNRANLKKANLTGANLQASNLLGSKLEGANLSGAKLSVANLRAANLQGAKLCGANLIGANLGKANLKGADLSGADLEGATLDGAILRNANLTGANLKMATLRDADLSGALMQDAKLEKADLANVRFEPTDAAQDSATEVPEEIGMKPYVPDNAFAGLVSSIQLSDLVQLVCLSRSGMLLRIRSKEGIGEIHVLSGKVCHAEFGSKKGEEAFFEILQWERGEFEALPPKKDVAASIDKTVEHLLIESMRKRDENGREGPVEEHSALISEMRLHMPIPAHPSKDLLKLVGRDGDKVDPYRQVQITDAFEAGDTGDILCSVTVDEQMFIAPLGYMIIKQDHPLFERISAYQTGLILDGR